jgi:hypothetical protein
VSRFLTLRRRAWAGDGTPSNSELVRAAVSLCAVVGRPVASHDATVDLLGLPDPP